MKKPGWIAIAAIGTLGLLLTGQAIFHEGVRRMKQIPLTNLKLKPYAFGQFLVDLPEGVEMANWKQEYKGAGPIKVSEGITIGQFETIVKQRADELRVVPHQEGGTMLEQVDKLALPNCQQVLYWDSELSKLQLECNAYFLLGNRLFKINPMTDPDFKSKNEMRVANEDIFRSMRLRNPDEIPTVPGFCFDGAIITEDISGMKHHSELVMVDIAWKERPDVHFSFYAIGNGEMLDPPLLERLKDAGSDPGEKRLRSGNRTVGPFHGEENLTRVKEKNNTEGHLFLWESQGVPFDPYNPQIRFDMTTGDGPNGAENTSLSDKDALRLWDAIVSSIRLRPTTKSPSMSENGAHGKVPQDSNSTSKPNMPSVGNAPIKPRAPLGTTLTTNERCTQTGIWECAHRDNQGGPKREFHEHQTLPEAFLDTKRGLLGKLMGRPARILVDTTWTLVGYLDET